MSSINQTNLTMDASLHVSDISNAQIQATKIINSDGAGMYILGLETVNAPLSDTMISFTERDILIENYENIRERKVSKLVSKTQLTELFENSEGRDKILIWVENISEPDLAEITLWSYNQALVSTIDEDTTSLKKHHCFIFERVHFDANGSQNTPQGFGLVVTNEENIQIILGREDNNDYVLILNTVNRDVITGEIVLNNVALGMPPGIGSKIPPKQK
jgi:hypothetical protein